LCNCGRGYHSHVVEICNLSLLVANDWEAQLAAGDLVNVLDPSSVRLNGVGGKADQLDTALGELGLQLREGAQLGGADRGVVFWVGEQDNPVVANELVEVNGALRSLSLEVGCDGSQAEAGADAISKSAVQYCKGRRSRLLMPCPCPELGWVPGSSHLPGLDGKLAVQSFCRGSGAIPTRPHMVG
jgi:hypothetical protein